MTSSKSAPIRSSSPLKGQFGFIYRIEDYVDNFVEELTKVVEHELVFARKELRTAALRDPSWAVLADDMDVEFVDDGFRYVVNGQEAYQTAVKLEYGSRG